MLVKQYGELLRRDDLVALGHERTDLFSVRVVGEHHHDAITAGSRGEVRVAIGQQRLTFVWIGTQHEQRNGLASRVAGGLRVVLRAMFSTGRCSALTDVRSARYRIRRSAMDADDN